MDFLTAAVIAPVAAALGGAVAYLYADRKCKAAAATLQTHLALADQRAAALAGELESHRQAIAKADNDLASTRQDLSTASAKIAALMAQLAGTEQNVRDQRKLLEESNTQLTATLTTDLETTRHQVATHQAALAAARNQLAEEQSRVATLNAQLAASEKNIAEQKNLLDTANDTLTKSFAALSRDALEKSNAAFIQMAEAKFKALSTEAAGTLDERKAQIGTLLKPLEEMLGNYQKRLAEMETQRTGAYAELRQQIGVMSATQAALSTQTTQLVSALTRPNVRGQWGEIALRKLVELAGMSDRCDFVEQTTTTDLDGNKLRPDMVVHLPADRQVVIDCKAVLGAFLDASAAPDEPARHAHMLRHSGLVRARAKDLSTKAYWQQFHNTPEFVVLFLPGEAFLYAACQHDATLLEDAIAAKVIIATPTTLIALLKSIEYGWRQQAVSENAEAIRKLGSEIYDRLATLADNMVRLGKSLDGAVDHYNKAVGTLESRVLVSARKISELGAGANKEIPDTPQIDKRTRELAATLHPDKSPLLPD
jgi:DNA recombination protein RmuC